MMKKIFSTLLSVAMLMGILAVGAAATDESDTTTAFRQAIAAGGEVNLTADITDLTRDIIVTPSSNAVTINGNGHTIDLEGAFAFHINNANTTVTFENVTITNSAQMGAIQNRASANVDITLEDVCITYGTLNSSISGTAVFNKNGDIKATDCTFTSIEGAINNYPILSNHKDGAKDLENCTFTFTETSDTNMEVVCKDGGWSVYPQSEATLKAWAEYSGWGTGTVAHINTDIRLTNDVTIASGKTLNVGEGATLTVKEGATLTATDATLTNNGTIVNGGTITGDVGGDGIVKKPVTSTIISYFVTVKTPENGTISPNSVYVASGVPREFTFTPDVGYEVADVLVNGKSVGAVEAYMLKVTGATTIEAKFAPAAAPFADVSADAWHYEFVLKAHHAGLMNGVDEGVFAPNVSTTRGMIATIVYSMAGSPEFDQETTFADVASGSYYETAIAWAKYNGIVSGYSDGTYKPNQNITREQLACILHNYAEYIGEDVSVGENTNILTYHDALQVSEYAIPAVQWMCGAGLMKGTADGNLDPQGLASRAEVATVLIRFLENA